MKMKRVLSLLLALVMTFSLLTLPSYAEDEDTAEETTSVEAVTSAEDAATAEDESAAEEVTAVEEDFSALTVAEQYAALMAMDEAEAEAVFYALTEEQQNELTEYAKTQTDTEPVREEYPIPAVNYTNVAPIIQTEDTAPAPAKKALKSASMKSAAAPYVPVDPIPVKGKTAEGLFMNKTATAKDDGSYEIKLEAYTTGSVTTVDTTKPTDIILVLDQSGSMAWDMTSYTYTEAYPGNNHNGEYYVQSNGSYVKVTWCSDCKAWTDGCRDRWFGFVHDAGTAHTPKASSADTAPGHEQFYTQAGSTTVRRLDALTSALTRFANTVKDKCAGADNQLGTTDDVDHRVAVVGFSSSGYSNTELLTVDQITQGNSHDKLDQTKNGTPYYYPTGYVQNGLQYSNSITNKQYADTLQQVKTTEGQTSVANAIAALTAHGGTETLDGLTMAENILKNSDGTGRNRVVILFTDGDTDSRPISDVVNKANTLKNTYHATVYTVGILDGANGQPPITNSTSAANALLHRISSNYPNATATWSRWSGTTYSDGALNPNLKDGDSYYLSASDVDALNDIFQKISQQMGSSTIDLGSTTTVKDIVSPYFTMPTNTSAVTVKTYDCTRFTDGKPTWNTTGTELKNAVTIDSTNSTVNVTGFDFNKNFVAENGRDENDPTKAGNFYGRKLEITFTVTPKDGFWGGNNVPTNGNESGVYVGNEQIATFDVPTVNIPLNVPELTASDKNIYLLGDAPSASDLGTFVKPAEAWKTQYVDISPITTDVEISNTEDTDNIPLSVTVTPKYTGKDASGTVQNAVTKTATANVNVFKPEVSFKDSTIYQGNTADYSVNKTDTPVWKHNGTLDSAVTMTGTKPNLSYDYSKAAAAFTDCTPVAVTVKIGTEDVTNKTNGKKDFTVHVLQPTVTATVNDVQKYYGEEYKLGDDANGSINVDWKDAHDHSNIPAASGAKPYEANDLTLTYSTKAFNGQDGIVPNSDFDVNVQVMKDTQEMPATITTTCDYGCETRTVDKDAYYTVHVKTCSLKVTKVVTGSVDDNQSFIFNVSGGNIPQSMQVTVQMGKNDNSVTIVGLPTGTYTVKEDQDWSWRYEAQEEGVATADLNTNHDAAVTITNNRTNNKWLSGDNYAINHVGGIKAHGTFVGN